MTCDSVTVTVTVTRHEAHGGGGATVVVVVETCSRTALPTILKFGNFLKISVKNSGRGPL